MTELNTDLQPNNKGEQPLQSQENQELSPRDQTGEKVGAQIENIFRDSAHPIQVFAYEGSNVTLNIYQGEQATSQGEQLPSTNQQSEGTRQPEEYDEKADDINYARGTLQKFQLEERATAEKDENWDSYTPEEKAKKKNQAEGRGITKFVRKHPDQAKILAAENAAVEVAYQKKLGADERARLRKEKQEREKAGTVTPTSSPEDTGNTGIPTADDKNHMGGADDDQDEEENADASTTDAPVEARPPLPVDEPSTEPHTTEPLAPDSPEPGGTAEVAPLNEEGSSVNTGNQAGARAASHDDTAPVESPIQPPADTGGEPPTVTVPDESTTAEQIPEEKHFSERVKRQKEASLSRVREQLNDMHVKKQEQGQPTEEPASEAESSAVSGEPTVDTTGDESPSQTVREPAEDTTRPEEAPKGDIPPSDETEPTQQPDEKAQLDEKSLADRANATLQRVKEGIRNRKALRDQGQADETDTTEPTVKTAEHDAFSQALEEQTNMIKAHEEQVEKLRAEGSIPSEAAPQATQEPVVTELDSEKSTPDEPQPDSTEAAATTEEEPMRIAVGNVLLQRDSGKESIVEAINEGRNGPLVLLRRSDGVYFNLGKDELESKLATEGSPWSWKQKSDEPAQGDADKDVHTDDTSGTEIAKDTETPPPAPAVNENEPSPGVDSHENVSPITNEEIEALTADQGSITPEDQERLEEIADLVGAGELPPAPINEAGVESLPLTEEQIAEAKAQIQRAQDAAEDAGQNESFTDEQRGRLRRLKTALSWTVSKGPGLWTATKIAAIIMGLVFVYTTVVVTGATSKK